MIFDSTNELTGPSIEPDTLRETTRILVEEGETLKFTISNQDNLARNEVSQNGKLAYTVLPANQTTSIVWVAPNQAGTYTVICTWHPGMKFKLRSNDQYAELKKAQRVEFSPCFLVKA